MEKWTRQTPETPDEKGDYMFKHVFYLTPGARELLTFEEMTGIIVELRTLAQEHDGIDYLQVYVRGDDKIWVIDQISKTMIKEGHYTEADGHATILLPSEY